MAIVENKAGNKEFKIPAALLGVGVLLYAAHALFVSGPMGVAGGLIFLGVALVIQLILGVIACVLANRLAGCDYGLFVPACWKLAAINIFPGAVSIFIPWGCAGYLVNVLIYWGLIEWLFELNPMDTVITVIAFWLAWVGSVFLAAVVIASLAH